MEDQLITFTDDNIYLEFSFEGKDYAVISESKDLKDDDDVYIVKVENLDNEMIARNIESDEEYQKVKDEFERILDEYSLDEGEEE